jgi:hypothetical protein
VVALAAAYEYTYKAAQVKPVTWGVDFSQSQAEYLHLDWKELYVAILEDLGAKHIKLHTNWDWVEGIKDSFYFKDTDWQVQQAEQHHADIIYVVGIKTGRWPECHAPLWTESLSPVNQETESLKYITAVVNRYKNSKAVAAWQVENEPLFGFGQCPSWYYTNTDFLKAEVALVKSLDPSRQVIISDSGEQSLWLGAAGIGDIVGITMYRSAWTKLSPSLGFQNYFFLNPASTYIQKADIVRRIYGKKVIGVELQAEPWVSEPLIGAPLGEQMQSMNPEIFKENVAFAKSTGLDTFYFWGAEWWYWMKTVQNQLGMWDAGRGVIQGK